MFAVTADSDVNVFVGRLMLAWQAKEELFSKALVYVLYVALGEKFFLISISFIHW